MANKKYFTTISFKFSVYTRSQNIQWGILNLNFSVYTRSQIFQWDITNYISLHMRFEKIKKIKILYFTLYFRENKKLKYSHAHNQNTFYWWYFNH